MLAVYYYDLLRYGIRTLEFARKRTLINKPKEIRKDLEDLLQSTGNTCTDLQSKLNTEFEKGKQEAQKDWDDYEQLSRLLIDFHNQITLDNRVNKPIYEGVRELKNDIKYLIDLANYAAPVERILFDQLTDQRHIDSATSNEIINYVKLLKFNYEKVTNFKEIKLHESIKAFEQSCKSSFKNYVNDQRTAQDTDYLDELKVDVLISTFSSCIERGASIKYESMNGKLYTEIPASDIEIKNAFWKQGINLKSKHHGFVGFVGKIDYFSYSKHVSKLLKKAIKKDKKYFLCYVVDTLDKRTIESVKTFYNPNMHLYVYNLDDNSLYFHQKNDHAKANSLLFTGNPVRNKEEFAALCYQKKEVSK